LLNLLSCVRPTAAVRSDTLARIRNQIMIVGPLAPGHTLKIAGAGEEVYEVHQRWAKLPPVERVLNLAQFERMAREVLGPDSRTWKLHSSYADDGSSGALE